MDPYEKMLREVLALTGFFLLALVAFALPMMIAGCGATVTHEVPAAERALDIADRLTQTRKEQAPSQDMPILQPVPRTVRLIIQDRQLVDYDAGGEQVLLGYMSCMDWSRGGARGTAR